MFANCWIIINFMEWKLNLHTFESTSAMNHYADWVVEVFKII